MGKRNTLLIIKDKEYKTPFKLRYDRNKRYNEMPEAQKEEIRRKAREYTRKRTPEQKRHVARLQTEWKQKCRAIDELCLEDFYKMMGSKLYARDLERMRTRLIRVRVDATTQTIFGQENQNQRQIETKIEEQTEPLNLRCPAYVKKLSKLNQQLTWSQREKVIDDLCLEEYYEYFGSKQEARNLKRLQSGRKKQYIDAEAQVDFETDMLLLRNNKKLFNKEPLDLSCKKQSQKDTIELKCEKPRVRISERGLTTKSKGRIDKRYISFKNDNPIIDAVGQADILQKSINLVLANQQVPSTSSNKTDHESKHSQKPEKAITNFDDLSAKNSIDPYTATSFNHSAKGYREAADNYASTSDVPFFSAKYIKSTSVTQSKGSNSSQTNSKINQLFKEPTIEQNFCALIKHQASNLINDADSATFASASRSSYYHTPNATDEQKETDYAIHS